MRACSHLMRVGAACVSVGNNAQSAHTHTHTAAAECTHTHTRRVSYVVWATACKTRYEYRGEVNHLYALSKLSHTHTHISGALTHTHTHTGAPSHPESTTART